jgi:putative nucleotidyltransferase with HDIG domain
VNSAVVNDSAERAAEAPEPRGVSDVFQFVERLATELSNGTLHLPSFPDAVIRIRQVLNDPHATTHLVAQVVQSEPVFTAKLFRMANSVMLQRGSEPVTDLKAVINRVGFGTLRNLAVALATRQIMNAKKYRALRDELRDLWEHSVETAAIAYLLARDSGCVDPDDAVLAGLIHDIGIFYIYSRIGDYPALFEDREAVARIIPDWHTSIGRAILEAWDFPSDLVEAVDEHETLDRTHVGHADLTDVITVANLLSHWQKPTEKPVAFDGLPALERLKLTAESAVEKLNESRREVESIKGALR